DFNKRLANMTVRYFNMQGPIPLESTQLVSDGDVITDAWSWRELMDRSSFNKDVMDLQVVYTSKQA
ncbi:pfh1, partial [Symbiodinium sp. KB8]